LKPSWAGSPRRSYRNYLCDFKIFTNSDLIRASLGAEFGPMRTEERQRSMPGISKKMLIQTLLELERDQLTSRQVFQVVPPMVEYTLTLFGRNFVEHLMLPYERAEQNSNLLYELESNRTRAVAIEKGELNSSEKVS
jgi:DNA-binding HxlR family transcriptional regulator